MTKAMIEKMLEEGEGFTVEFKTCVNELSRSVYETVVAFSNRYGGYILLGVEETVDHKGNVIGVNPSSVPSMKKNFTNMLNNDEAICPSLYLNLEEIEIGGKLILYVYVPVSSQVETFNKKVWDRNHEGDYDITSSTDLVANLYARKSGSYHERRIYPYVTIDHLRMDLLPKMRQMAIIKKGDHPWKEMDDMQLLRNAGLYEENFLTGEKGFNLAAILLLGKDEVIHSACPGYRTDAIYRDEHPDRYDDRLIVETNLIESYALLTEFIAKHSNDKFHLVDGVAISIRDIMAREIVSNILVHREYSNAFPAKIIIDRERITTENWNRPQFPGKIDPNGFTPYPKNPILSKVFMNIGLADSLGSGVRNLYKCCKIYCGADPILEEGDVFRIYVPLTIEEAGEVKRYSLPNRRQAILTEIKTNPKIRVEELMEIFQMSRASILREIQGIKEVAGLKYNKKKQAWVFK